MQIRKPNVKEAGISATPRAFSSLFNGNNWNFSVQLKAHCSIWYCLLLALFGSCDSTAYRNALVMTIKCILLHRCDVDLVEKETIFVGFVFFSLFCFFFAFLLFSQLIFNERFYLETIKYVITIDLVLKTNWIQYDWITCVLSSKILYYDVCVFDPLFLLHSINRLEIDGFVFWNENSQFVNRLEHFIWRQVFILDNCHLVSHRNSHIELQVQQTVRRCKYCVFAMPFTFDRLNMCESNNTCCVFSVCMRVSTWPLLDNSKK